jgi:trehalose synthase
VAAAGVGVRDLDAVTDEQVEQIRRAHLLLAAYNALQPGVFALSGWDLAGILTLDPASVSDLMADADTRWINRGAHDLLGRDPSATRSSSGLPRGRSLYGSLPDQLVDPDSFVSRLRSMLALRARHAIAEAALVEVPDVDAAGVLALVLRLLDGTVVVTVINFSAETCETTVRSEHFAAGVETVDLGTDEAQGVVDPVHGLRLTLSGHEARVLRVG